jgi:hypothetical protein
VPGIRFEGGERVLGSLARQIFQPIAGRVPAGTIPAAWLPATPVAA